MANRSITVTLRANVQDFKQQFDAATKAADQTAKATEDSAKRADTAMGRMVDSARNNSQAWTTAGTTLAAFGAAALGGLGLAVKAAIDWESAWAGVQKTVDGTAPQMAALEAGLRSMARELPATHQEIAAVAEAAGQLGIATPNILGFTRTMIDLGEATNLSADEAATALARFITVTGTSQSDIGKLGAAVVGLGNNFATTEAEIVQLSQRLAAAGTQAGFSEGEILGLATAMSQVGVNAEAGGTAMTQTMNRISKSVEEGGDSLDLFAQVSGMTADEFATAWQERPAEALVAFTEGLGRTEELGMSTNAVLTELGITGLREADVMRRLALATGTMSDAMAMGNEEFDKGTALIEEASQRYETAESRIAMARNALVDMGISVGGTVLPVLANLADGAADLFGAFADLPGPVHAVMGGLAGVAGAATLGVGSFLLITPRVLDTVSAFRDLGAISPGTASKVGRLTLGIGKLGLAVAALAAVPPVLNAVTDAIRGIDNAELDLGMNELTSGLLEGERSGRVFDNVLGDMYESGALNKQMFSDLGGTIQEVSNINWFQNLIGPLAATGINDAKDRLEGLSDAFVVLAQTDLSKAQGTFAAFIAEAEAGGATFEQVMEVMPTFRNELVGLAESMGLDGTDSAVLYKLAIGEIAPVVDEATGAVVGFEDGIEGAEEGMQSAAEAADELYESMSGIANGFLTARGAARDYNDALAEASDAIEEHGRKWDEQSEAGDALGEAIDGVAESILANADAMIQQGDSAGAYLGEQRNVLIELAKEMGATQEQAEAYVDALGLTPEYIETQVQLDTDAAMEKWDQIFAEIWPDGGHPPMVIETEVDPDDNLPQFTGLIDSIPPETNTDVNVDTDEAAEKAWGFQGVIEGATEDQTATVTADVEPAVWEVNRFEAVVDEAGGTVEINGETLPADQALSTLMGIVNSSDGTVTIDGMTVPADQALSTVIGIINGSEGTVTIEGNNNPANSATDSAVGHANRSSGTINVGADTSSANSGINHAARTRYSTIRVSYSVVGGVPTMNVGNRTATARAMGGPVFGPGTETSDSIPARLSNNEHVFAAREVKAAGGHQAIYSLRQQLMAGARTLHLATGGGVENGSVAPVQSSPVYQQARVQNVNASVDSSGIASAVGAAMSSWRPMVELGGTKFYGVMKQTSHQYGTRS